MWERQKHETGLYFMYCNIQTCSPFLSLTVFFPSVCRLEVQLLASNAIHRYIRHEIFISLCLETSACSEGLQNLLSCSSPLIKFYEHCEDVTRWRTVMKRHKSPGIFQIPAERSKQEVKHYVLRSINLLIPFEIRENYRSCSINVLL